MSELQRFRAGHSGVCWAAALGAARRDRPPEDWAVSEQRAAQLLADDPDLCLCARIGRGRAGRRPRRP